MGEAKDEGRGGVTIEPAGIPSAGSVGTPSLYHWRDFDPSQAEGSAKDLAAELTTYRDRIDELLAHAGEYVVIKGDRIVGYYPDSTDAFLSAQVVLGDVTFLVKRVVEYERPLLGGSAY